jgi:hypothetical protein
MDKKTMAAGWSWLAHPPLHLEIDVRPRRKPRSKLRVLLYGAPLPWPISANQRSAAWAMSTHANYECRSKVPRQDWCLDTKQQSAATALTSQLISLYTHRSTPSRRAFSSSGVHRCFPPIYRRMQLCMHTCDANVIVYSQLLGCAVLQRTSGCPFSEKIVDIRVAGMQPSAPQGGSIAHGHRSCTGLRCRSSTSASYQTHAAAVTLGHAACALTVPPLLDLMLHGDTAAGTPTERQALTS